MHPHRDSEQPPEAALGRSRTPGRPAKRRRRVLRRPLAAVVTAVATLALLLPAAGAGPTPAAASAGLRPAAEQPLLDLTGHGFGHGRGMSQYGARGAALQGRNYKQILWFYYRGIRYEEFRHWVKVRLTADVDGNLIVRPRSGLAVRDLGTRRTYRLPGNGAVAWRLQGANGNIRLSYYLRGWRTWRGLSRPLTSSAQFLVLNRRGQAVAWPAITVKLTRQLERPYRGFLRLTHQDTVNYLPMNSYLKGVVASEMPASWPNPALRSQIVAARSYAVHELDQRRGSYWQLCDTTQCQVYRGVAGEHPRTNQLIDTTPQIYMTYGGEPAFAQFSSSSGGWTVNGGRPYLRAKADPYDAHSGNPMHTWRVRVSTAPLVARYPRIGSFVRLRILERDGNGDWGGRVLRARVVGTNGSVQVSGDDLRWALGLRSSWFRVS